jgi:sulfate transporter 4
MTKIEKKNQNQDKIFTKNQIFEYEKNKNNKAEDGKKDENAINQVFGVSCNDNQIPPFLGEWVKVSDAHNIEYQKIFKSSQENFIKNTHVLFMRYELFHLCLTELVYESKGKSMINSFILGQISKIHEQLFKVGLKNIANIFENEKYSDSLQNKNNLNQLDVKLLTEAERKNFLKFKNEISQNNSYKNTKSLPFSFTWTFYRLFPILSWFPQYKWRKYLKDDVVAGITVGVMLIAQGMAYAKLAGLSPEYGLYSSGLPLFIYPLFGTSRHLGIGPVALVSLLVSQVTLSTNNAGHEYSLSEKTSFALLIAFCVGIVQISMAFLQIGFIINFISHPVIAGFTTAAAFVIILTQLQHILGYSVQKSHYPFLTLFSYISNLHKFKWQPFSFGLVNIVLMQMIKHVNKKFKLEIPGPIFCVFISILTTQVFRLDRFGISIQNNIPKGFPRIRGPIFNELSKVAPTIFTIAFINFLETIAIASKIGEKHGYKIVPDQELLGSGMANLFGSFVCAFPIAGSFSRTAVLSQAGAKTQMAGVFTGIVIILTYLFLTPLFTYLPNVSLASIILISVVNLIDYKEALHLLEIRFLDFLSFMISLFFTFMMGVEWGMVIAISVSLVIVLWFSIKPPICVLGRIPGTVVYKDLNWYSSCMKTPGGILIRMDAPLFFVNAAVLRKKIRQKEEEYTRANPVSIFYIILDCRGMTDIDCTGIQVLNELAEKYNKNGVFLGFANVNERVRKVLKAGGIDKLVEKNRFFTRIHDGVESAIKWKFLHVKKEAKK